MSSSLSIYLRVFHSCTILTLYFFHLSFDRGQRIVATGLYCRSQGRQTKMSFDFVVRLGPWALVRDHCHKYERRWSLNVRALDALIVI